MACLQIYRELLNLPTFLRVHSNSKELSYLSWQNTYPNLKTNCHMKLKFSCELNSKELTPYKISHIRRCAFNFAELLSLSRIFLVSRNLFLRLKIFSKFSWNSISWFGSNIAKIDSAKVSSMEKSSVKVMQSVAETFLP